MFGDPRLYDLDHCHNGCASIDYVCGFLEVQERLEESVAWWESPSFSTSQPWKRSENPNDQAGDLARLNWSGLVVLPRRLPMVSAVLLPKLRPHIIAPSY